MYIAIPPQRIPHGSVYVLEFVRNTTLSLTKDVVVNRNQHDRHVHTNSESFCYENLYRVGLLQCIFRYLNFIVFFLFFDKDAYFRVLVFFSF